MSFIQWYADALNRADNDKDIDRSMLRVMVLVIAGLLVLIAIVAANIALIIWKWWLGAPLLAYLIYRAVYWALTDHEKETTS